MIRAGSGAAALALLLAGCEPAEVSENGVYNLPSELNEVSGLAVAGPDSVFTHDDEYAIIYEFRLRDGHMLRTFALGEPTIEGDFEGIAVWAGQVFLVTSDGLIYAARPGRNGERVPYRVYDSGIGPRCEIEGLSQSPDPDELLLLCKRFRNDSEEARLEIYRWKIGRDRAEAAPFLSLPLETLMPGDELAEFRPSGLEFDPASGQLLVISARARTLLVLDRAGRFIERKRFQANRHPETEGITVMPDGRLVLADEGSKTREGRLTTYRLRPSGASGTP